jgi:hypothetical protein
MKNKAYLVALYAKKFENSSYQPDTSDSMELSGGIDFVQKMYSDCLKKDISNDIQEPKPENEKRREQLLPGDIVFTDISHTSIYIGNNEIIYTDENNIVKISKITNFYKAIRIDKSLYKNEYIYNHINYHPDVNIGDIIFRSNTGLHETDENWEFLFGDYNNNGTLDLYCINKKNTGSNTTEVHILDGTTNFKTFLLQTKTPLHETEDNFQFLLGDYNKSGTLDLYCIKKCNTGTNSTEVHILNGNDNFQSFLLNTGTSFHETGDNWQFLLGDYNNNGTLDLYCIKKSNTGTNSTEVHILDGNDNFQSYLLNTGTALPEVGDCYVFQLEDYNNDGKLDLYCIKKFGNESNSTEINIISGIDNLQSLIKNIRTKIPETNKNYSFCPFKDRMYVIDKKGFNCTDILCLKI